MMLVIRQFVAAILVLVSVPANACMVAVEQDMNDLRYADVVVVGRIENYEIVRDMAFREKMLANPNLSEYLRKIYSDETQGLLGDYARFDVHVEEVLAGEVPERITATWDNSTFGEASSLSPNSLVIAFRRSASPMPPLRGPSATVLPNPDPKLLTVLQAPCSSAFIFNSSPEVIRQVKRILATKPKAAPDR